MAAVKKTKESPSNAKTAALVVMAVLAIVAALVLGSRFIGGVASENQNFGPSEKVLQKYSPPGYTPYGQPLKPGETRPPYRAGAPSNR
jgi:hypothetical protein